MAKTKIFELEDIDGFKLPQNVSTQFRSLQGGIEHLKISSDEIKSEIKGVDKKLTKNTTDLNKITDKVNSIDESLKKHMKQSSTNLNQLQSINKTLLELVKDIYKELDSQKNNVDQIVDFINNQKKG